jgi:hypothetical protein
VRRFNNAVRRSLAASNWKNAHRLVMYAILGARQRFLRNWRQCPDIEVLFRGSLQHNQRVTET